MMLPSLSLNHAALAPPPIEIPFTVFRPPGRSYSWKMTPHGQRQVDAAKADGRWDAAYAPIRSASASSIPDDLRAAIEANPRARKTFATLTRQNLFALTFRTNNMKTPAGRAKKITALVDMLARGETIVPQRDPR